jgi:hypothetical protein
VMTRKTALPLLFLVLFSAQFVFAQDAPPPPAPGADSETAVEAAAKKREIGLALVRETGIEIESLQSPGNRISFFTSLAEISYDLDKDFSRRMYLGLADAISRQISATTGEIVSAASRAGSDRQLGERLGRGMIMKILRASQTRSNAVLSAARRDPLLGLDMLELTRVADPGTLSSEMRGLRGLSMLGDDDALISQIVEKIDTDDSETLDEFSKRILKNGLSSGAVALLQKIRAKNAEKGALYAREVFSAAGREVDAIDPNHSAIGQLITFATEELSKPSAGSQSHPLVTRAEVKELADRFGRLVLRLDEDKLEYYSAMTYSSAVRPYSPSLATQIAKKFGIEEEDLEEPFFSSVPPPPPAMAAEKIAEASKDATSVSSGEDQAEVQAAAAKKAREEDLLKRMSSPEDDPEKEAAARQFADEKMREAQETGDPIARTAMLVGLANGMKERGFATLSSEILAEAFRSVTNNPRTSTDFLQIWTLAMGISNSDPEKAFSMVEDLVFRLNDVAAAFVRFAEFIDTEGVILENGELLFDGLGGGMLAQMKRTLDGSGSMVKTLAEADLPRTKALADRFDRPEIRVAARLLILNSLFTIEQKTEGEEQEGPGT